MYLSIIYSNIKCTYTEIALHTILKNGNNVIHSDKDLYEEYQQSSYK